MTKFTNDFCATQIDTPDIAPDRSLPKARIEFNTREYEFSHGHGPRGRGSWAFFFDRAMRIDDAYWARDAMGNTSLTYGEAKKYARAEAQRRGVCEVFVGS